MGWLGVMTMAAFWIAVIVGIVFLIRWLATPTGPRDCRPEAGKSTLEILHRRYALDEISKEEFEDKMKDLGY